MLLNLLYINYKNDINHQTINKILLLSFVIYLILNKFFFKSYITIICVFDALYFMMNFIELNKKNIKEKKEKENKPLLKNLIQNINNINSDNNPCDKQLSIDPELQSEKFKLCSFDIKNTLTQITNNLSN